MPPTAESVLLQRRPVSGQNRITSQFLPHAPPSDRPSSSRYNRCLNRDTVKMRMKMSEDSEGELVNGSDSDVRFQFFYKEPCLYSHQTYNNASKIFSTLRHESLEERENPYLKKRNKVALSEREIPQLHFSNDQDKRLAFELAFSTLKYQLLFEEILQDCAFFSSYPE
ncbi:putative methyltransferase NSUN7, partial [Saccostrea cucullata]|uniref:putative methyltransferase NSUN7 n=1 Tax=Saccostrea cuccullata TaxID=36930 RepID=UPI002ED09457